MDALDIRTHLSLGYFCSLPIYSSLSPLAYLSRVILLVPSALHVPLTCPYPALDLHHTHPVSDLYFDPILAPSIRCTPHGCRFMPLLLQRLPSISCAFPLPRVCGWDSPSRHCLQARFHQACGTIGVRGSQKKTAEISPYM